MRAQSEQRVANEVLVREVNERIYDVAARLVVPSDRANVVGFLCECGELSCPAQVEMTLAEYAALRAHPGLIAVAAAHTGATDGRVVARNPRYVLVNRERLTPGGARKDRPA
jgi:hypothetical protein